MIEAHMILVRDLCWHDKEHNACGVFAGQAVHCHAIESICDELERLSVECAEKDELIAALYQTLDENGIAVPDEYTASTRQENDGG